MGLTRRKDGWYVEFRVLDDGKTLTLARGIAGAKLKRWKVGSFNKTVAKQQEALIKTELMKGLVKSDQTQPRSFKEWGQTYLQLEEVRALISYQDRVNAITLQLIPFFGKKSIMDIKPEDIETYRRQRKRWDGKPARLGTVNNDHIILKHCLNVAVRKGLLVVNPATKVPMPDPKNERDRILTEHEWSLLYEAAASHMKPILLLAYQLEPRLGEILNLTWDRVDSQRGFITLRAIDTKTRQPRQVPMTPSVRATLTELSKVRSLVHKQVFLYRGKPVKEIKVAFRSAVRRAGIENLRFHDLRHCAATNLRRAGVDTVTAMRIVGHKSEKMHQRYNSVSEADLSTAAQRLNSYLSNTVITPATSDETVQAVSA